MDTHRVQEPCLLCSQTRGVLHGAPGVLSYNRACCKLLPDSP